MRECWERFSPSQKYCSATFLARTRLTVERKIKREDQEPRSRAKIKSEDQERRSRDSVERKDIRSGIGKERATSNKRQATSEIEIRSGID
ncbi:hypothetical protein [Paenibacillus sp. GP183]|uniref:hypothetical protein n=1 Tax=Paenibacillus sp. GP183 TaxID=1882751 RepID=UPI00089699C6|nr:hypothetical protein [Paenibacillus sp. GP183]SEC73781.1 hypothetical protein SAMN05443246_5190 [Paenibacillus sp. GP183]